jgi:hypothetical protein
MASSITLMAKMRDCRDGRVAEWFKAPVLKVAGLGVNPYRVVPQGPVFRDFQRGAV